MTPDIRNAMIFAHKSEERGHIAMLEALDAKPLLDLDMRLGEGTGRIAGVATRQGRSSHDERHGEFR